MAQFKKYFALEKMEEQEDGTLHVYGVVTKEEPDREKEVCDYATSKPLYEKFCRAQLERTSKGGMTPSIMPLREMHQTVTQGAGRAIDFDDAAKTIRMGFEVVDPVAVKKWKAGCFVGFSQGGSYVKRWEDPDFKGCIRYTADPIEVSAVDVPCLPSALLETMKGRTVELHKANGGIEMVKMGAIEEASSKSESLETQVATIAKALADIQKAMAKTTTKRVADEDLPASAFAYVGDPEKTETWKLPIKFSSEEKTKAHIRNALARFNQTQGIPAGEKAKVRAKILAAAKQHGIDVSESNKAAIGEWLGKNDVEAGKLAERITDMKFAALQVQEGGDVDPDISEDAKLFSAKGSKAVKPEAGKVNTMNGFDELMKGIDDDLTEIEKAAADGGADGSADHAKLHAAHHAKMCKVHAAHHALHKGLSESAPDEYNKGFHKGMCKLHKSAHAHHLAMHKAWSKKAGIEPQAIAPIEDGGGDGGASKAVMLELDSVKKALADLTAKLGTIQVGKAAQSGVTDNDLSKRGGESALDLGHLAVSSADLK